MVCKMTDNAANRVPESEKSDYFGISLVKTRRKRQNREMYRKNTIS